MSLFGKVPSVSADAFVAPNAAVVGQVTVGSQASLLFGAVVRGVCPSALAFTPCLARPSVCVPCVSRASLHVIMRAQAT